MSDVEKELATLKEEQERNRKRIEILKAKIRAEMMVLDKLLDVEDPNEIRAVSYTHLTLPTKA
mgnify:CR=1 FL=1